MIEQKRIVAGQAAILMVVIFAIMTQQRQSAVVEAGPLDMFKMVDTGASERYAGGYHVGVNVPLIYNLDMDTRPNHTGLRLDESILKGLVHVYINREKQGDKLKGPIKVSVGGVTMYSNDQPDLN